jgi:hypothetical protein
MTVQARAGVFSAAYSWLSALLTAFAGLFVARDLQFDWPYASSSVSAVIVKCDISWIMVP